MKRVTIFAGHYGSGKTNVAVNYARYLKQQGHRVAIADLDIVNPYFRTKDSAAQLSREGIELVVSDYANSNVDFPAMPKEVYSLLDAHDTKLVMDVGGDERGALALGRYVPDILREDDYEMLAVVNASRPLTATVDDAVGVLREIEDACGLRFTGIVNNTNLGLQTTAETVLGSCAYALGVARGMGIGLKMTTVDARIVDSLGDTLPTVFPLTIEKMYYMVEN